MNNLNKHLENIDKTKLINNVDINMYGRIYENLNQCKGFIFNVAFIHYSGTQIFLDVLKTLESNNIKGKILTTNYMNSTEIKAVEKIQTFSNLELKVYDTSINKNGFHPKTYIFKYENYSTVFIGSSNLTTSGLKRNIEWNLEFNLDNDSILLKEIEDNFASLWDSSSPFDESLFEYKDLRKEVLNVLHKDGQFVKNKMQILALDNLKKMREENKSKGLAIAATGTGKTLLSAFDIREFNAKKVLFIVHRQEIINDASLVYREFFKTNKNIGEYSGNLKDTENKDIIFSSVQLLFRNSNYKNFKHDEFDYIIIDEAHHSSSESYSFIFKYFKPKFLLGLTATPERYDGDDIFKLFDDNVAIDVRLRDALNDDLLVPFNYFGVNDKTVEWNDIDANKINTYEKKLLKESRVDFIIEKIIFYDHDGSKTRCLAFCASRIHARFMYEEFSKRGYKSVYLTGEDSFEKRKNVLQDLRVGNIQYIFTVDIFNEGIDIPEINLILMLRPTQSPTIFIQQLGRGLRKNIDKEFLTIIDFIGNHNNIGNIAFALKSNIGDSKIDFIKSIKNNFNDFSSNSFFIIDEISKNEILKKIESINFSSQTKLRESYNNFKTDFESKHIPMWLDYLKDGSPDIEKFIQLTQNKYRTYFSFLKDIIQEEVDINISDKELKLLKLIENIFPLKRLLEFKILKYIFENKDIHFIKKTDIENVSYELKENKEDIIFSLENYFTCKFLSKDLIDSYCHLIELKDDSYFINRDIFEIDKKFNSSKHFKNYLSNFLFFSNVKYDSKLKRDSNNFILNQKYSRNDILFLINYSRVYSSQREGVLEWENCYYLFVTLNKYNFKESHMYKDHFENENIFQWQSQNQSGLTSQIFNDFKENAKKIKLFIRDIKNDKEDNRYIYVGEAFYLSHSGEKPITFRLKLKNIYYDWHEFNS